MRGWQGGGAAGELKAGGWVGVVGGLSTVIPPFPQQDSPSPSPTSSPPPNVHVPSRQNLIKKPLEIWPRVAMGIARSSLFLTLFIAAGFGGAQRWGPVLRPESLTLFDHLLLLLWFQH